MVYVEGNNLNDSRPSSHLSIHQPKLGLNQKVLTDWKILCKLWHIVAITGQSKMRVYLATLSSGHNLIKTDDIVREHIKDYKMKTLHKLCA